MRKEIASLTLLLLGLTAAVPTLMAAKPALADDAPFQSQTFAMDGVVKAVDVDRDRVTLQGSDGKAYTLDTSQSDITLIDGNKAGMTADLSPGNRVHVTGHLLSSSIAEVDQLRVLDNTRPSLTRPTSPRGSQDGVGAAPVPIDFRGTVASVDTRRGAFVVQVKDHTRTVLLADNTDVSGMKLPNPTLFPVNVGDRVTVAGLLQPDGDVLAGVLSLSRDVPFPAAAPPPAPRTPSVVGRVWATSNRYTSRDIKIHLDENGREVKIKVPRGIPIRRNGRPISVHDLSDNDEVRVTGVYDGSDFRATRIDVLGPANDANRGSFSRL